jgi:hypothetical protein
MRMVEHVSSVISGPVRPSSPLCHHPGHCRAIPSTVQTQANRTSPCLPLCSFQSPVSQTLELVYGRQLDKESGATTLEVAPKRTQELPRHLPGMRFAKTVIESLTLCAMPPHNA